MFTLQKKIAIVPVILEQIGATDIRVHALAFLLGTLCCTLTHPLFDFVAVLNLLQHYYRVFDIRGY